MEPLKDYTNLLKKSHFYDMVCKVIDTQTDKVDELAELKRRHNYHGSLQAHYINEAAELFTIIRHRRANEIHISDYEIHIAHWGAYAYEPLTRDVFLFVLYCIVCCDSRSKIEKKGAAKLIADYLTESGSSMTEIINHMEGHRKEYNDETDENIALFTEFLITEKDMRDKTALNYAKMLVEPKIAKLLESEGLDTSLYEIRDEAVLKTFLEYLISSGTDPRGYLTSAVKKYIEWVKNKVSEQVYHEEVHSDVDIQEGLFQETCQLAMYVNFQDAYNYYVLLYAKTNGTRNNRLNWGFDHSYWKDTASRLIRELTSEKYEAIDFIGLFDNEDHIRAHELVRILAEKVPGKDGWKYWQLIARWRIAEKLLNVYFEYSALADMWTASNEVFTLREAESLVMTDRPAYSREELNQRVETVKKLIMGVEARELPQVEKTEPFIESEDVHKLRNEYEQKLLDANQRHQKAMIEAKESAQKEIQELKDANQKSLQELKDSMVKDALGKLADKDKEIEALKKELEQAQQSQKGNSQFLFVSLSDEFPKKLRKNKVACEMMITIIRDIVDPLVENKKRWTWGHVMQGMTEAKVINMNGAEFGRAINSILPDRTADNIERSVRGFTSKKVNQLTDKDQNIVDQIKTIFEMVHEIAF